MSFAAKEDELLARLQKCVGKLDTPAHTTQNRRQSINQFGHREQSQNMDMYPRQGRNHEQYDSIRLPIKSVNLNPRSNFRNQYSSSQNMPDGAYNHRRQNKGSDRFENRRNQAMAPSRANVQNYDYQASRKSYQNPKNQRKRYSMNADFSQENQVLAQKPYLKGQSNRCEAESRVPRRALGELNNNLEQKNMSYKIDRKSERPTYDDNYESKYDAPRIKSRQYEGGSEIKPVVKRPSISALRPEPSSKYLEASYSINFDQVNPPNPRKWREQIQSQAKTRPQLPEQYKRQQTKRQPVDEISNRYNNRTKQVSTPIHSNNYAARYSSAVKVEAFQGRPSLNNSYAQAEKRDYSSTKTRPAIGSITKRNQQAFSSSEQHQLRVPKPDESDSRNFVQQNKHFSEEREARPNKDVIREARPNKDVIRQTRPNKDVIAYAPQNSLKSSRRQNIKAAFEDSNFNDRDTFQKLQKISQLNENINRRIKNIIDTFESK